MMNSLEDEPPPILRRRLWALGKLFRMTWRIYPNVLLSLVLIFTFPTNAIAKEPIPTYGPHRPPLPADFFVKPLIVATEMGTPEKELIAKEKAAKEAAKKAASARYSRATYSPGNTYGFGYCTYHVKQLRPDLPNKMGNANRWLSNAPSTGSEPRVGAVVVTTESGLGHVAFISGIEGNHLILSEMNYRGWNVISSRKLAINSGVIRGYVY